MRIEDVAMVSLAVGLMAMLAAVLGVISDWITKRQERARSSMERATKTWSGGSWRGGS